MNVCSVSCIRAESMMLVRLAFVCLMYCFSGHALAQWPTIDTPPGAVTRDMGGVIVLNGTPIKSLEFFSNDTVRNVSSWFKKQPGRKWFEKVTAQAVILTTVVGDYLVTVQIEPRGSQARGMIGISDQRVAAAERGRTAETRAQILGKLPPGTILNSYSTSLDGPKKGIQLLYQNSATFGENKEALGKFLSTMDLKFYAENTSKSDLAANENAAILFSGPSKEAMATLGRDTFGRTVVFLVIVIS